MSVPPLIQLPQNSCISNIVMTLTSVSAVGESPFTLEQQAYKWPGQRWSASVDVPATTRRDVAGEWMAFFAKLEGRYGHFLLGDPTARAPRGVGTGTPIVDGVNQTGNTLVTSGWANSVTGILLPGDYIQIGTGTSARLHMVVEAANSGAGGGASLIIQPALRGSPANGAPIIVNNAKGKFRLGDNSFSYSVAPGPVWKFSFEAVEVL